MNVRMRREPYGMRATWRRFGYLKSTPQHTYLSETTLFRSPQLQIHDAVGNRLVVFK